MGQFNTISFKAQCNRCIHSIGNR
ncbi:hypothetical protein D047_0924A, partial [Vibrio parahaemolyticus VPTS-2010_2]